jgi:hypothetical protein
MTSELVVRTDVVAEDEVFRHARRLPRSAVGGQHVAAVNDRVVLDGDLGGPLPDLHEGAVPAPFRSVDGVDQVVGYPYPPHRSAGAVAVAREQVERRGRVPDDVVAEGHILDRRPRRGAAFAARREDDRVPRLSIDPVVLEEIAFDQDAGARS